MSCSLYYNPVKNIKGKQVGNHQLRNILENKFGYPSILSADHLSYLNGLKDVNIDGANDLILAIEKYEEIEIYKEC